MTAGMVRLEKTVRAIPLWLLQVYLQELGGKVLEDGYIQGPGWSARLEQLQDLPVGSLRVGQVHLELEADPGALDDLRPALEKKLLRAGG